MPLTASEEAKDQRMRVRRRVSYMEKSVQAFL